MASRNERLESKQESGAPQRDATKRIRAVLPGSPLPGRGAASGRNRYCHYSKIPFRLPSLNASPTCSVDDLSFDDDTSRNGAPLYTLASAGVDSSESGNPISMVNYRSRKCDSPGSYRKTLEQLAALRKQRPMLGSTSDYFSLTSSTCSDDGDYCAFEFNCDFENGDEDVDGANSEYVWPLSPKTDVGELRSVAEKVLRQGGEDVRIKADLLDNICQQTRDLERRNEELRQELEQLHFDTKKFVEKTNVNTGEPGENGRQWADQDFALVFNDNETAL